MVQQRAALVVLATLAVLSTGCGGGSSAPPPINTGGAAPTAPSSTSSGSVSPSGGSVSTTLNNQETITVTVPPGGVSAATTLTVTAYAPGQGPNGKVISAHTRSTKVYTSGTDTLIADVVIDAGGATLLKPLQLSVATASAPASGSNAYVEGYNNGGFDDVESASYASGAYTTNADPTFPGLTLASKTEYVLYTHAGTITGDGTIALNAPASVPVGTTATITPTETTANGFPYLQRTFNFAVTGNAGTVSPATGPSTTFTPNPTGGNGTVTAQDALVTTRTASAAIASASARPGASGFSAQYTGTYSENDVNNVIGSTPVPSAMSYQVATTISTANDNSGNTVFTSTEADNGGLKTVTTTTNATVAYQASGSSTNVRTLKTVATDSNGVTYETDYGANNGLQTVLPESGGSFSNDGQLEYKETDPGIAGIGAVSMQNAARRRARASTAARTATARTRSTTARTRPAASVVDNVASGGVELQRRPAAELGARTAASTSFNPPSGSTIEYQLLQPDHVGASVADRRRFPTGFRPRCRSRRSRPTRSRPGSRSIRAARRRRRSPRRPRRR